MIFGTYLGFADRWVMSTMVCKVRSMKGVFFLPLFAIVHIPFPLLTCT